MRQSKWDVTGDIDFEQFSSGDKLIFVKAEHDNSSLDDGFKFFVYGLLDEDGRFHVLGTEVTPTPPDQAMS